MILKTFSYCMVLCLSCVAFLAGTHLVQAGLGEQASGNPAQTALPLRSYSTNIVRADTKSTSSPVKAVISATPTTGGTPLSVNFTGTSSTGTIASYHWDFGDGTTAEGANIDHMYTLGGTYTAKLVITDVTGASNIAFISVHAKESKESTAQPRAIIGKLQTHASNPMSVQFDGSKSKAALPATITSYVWNFGDGTTATGATISHSFTIAGTYTATLIVTDSNGMTNRCNLPVVVSPPS